MVLGNEAGMHQQNPKLSHLHRTKPPEFFHNHLWFHPVNWEHNKIYYYSSDKKTYCAQSSEHAEEGTAYMTQRAYDLKFLIHHMFDAPD